MDIITECLQRCSKNQRNTAAIDDDVLPCRISLNNLQIQCDSMAMMAGVGLQPVLQIETVWLDVIHRPPNQRQSRAIWPEFFTLDGGHHNILCAVPWHFEPDGRSSPVPTPQLQHGCRQFLCTRIILPMRHSSRSRDGGVPSKGNGGPGPRARCCSPSGHRSRHKAGRPVGGRQRRGGLPSSPQNSARALHRG